jgi:mono/diheme cytochrome c family protein
VAATAAALSGHHLLAGVPARAARHRASVRLGRGRKDVAQGGAIGRGADTGERGLCIPSVGDRTWDLCPSRPSWSTGSSCGPASRGQILALVVELGTLYGSHPSFIVFATVGRPSAAQGVTMRNLSIAFVGLVAFAPSALAADKTERLWQAKCAACHGDDGKGQTTKGKEMALKDMTTSDWQKSLTDEKIQKGIEDGVDRTTDGKKQKMDPYKDKLKPEQIADLVKYIRSLAAK